MLASAVWFSVPQCLIDRDWMRLGNVFMFDPDMRVFVVGIGLSLLAVASERGLACDNDVRSYRAPPRLWS